MRARVRHFIADELAANRFTPTSDSWCAADPSFSRRCGEAGFIAMTWPKQYGGHERTAFERYVVVEELLAAGAPVAAHWIADRQSGPQILRNGSQRARDTILPGIAAGRTFFAIGMSEPDVGSDLAAVRTRATKVEGGWNVNGRKVWSSGAHLAQYMIALVRTSGSHEDRHKGLTQLIVDLKSPGVAVRPIENLSGAKDFNETVFDDCFVPDDMILGGEGRGWEMVTAELAFERSGPERFMSTMPLFLAALDGMPRTPTAAQEVGRAAAHLTALRAMSMSVAGSLQRGEAPNTEASLVKDVGAVFEQTLPDTIRRCRPTEPYAGEAGSYEAQLAHAVYHAPSFSLRGGTREILRGIIARGLGLR
ncbi:MAG: acyl-CoA dehydrogenase family protein [Hyphomicrobium sp.]|nr:acyl-CoA dehydrogenase family protein [Hyphomicrobium sp.]